MNPISLSGAEYIFENISEDLSLPYDEYKRHIEELIASRYIQCYSTEEDRTLYGARPGLKWLEVKALPDPTKRKILLELIENPKTIFVLYNTQKGKAKIIALKLKQWAEDISPTSKPVIFVMLSNDKTLGDQSLDSFLKTIGENRIKAFLLSSSHKNTIDSITTYIDAYSTNDDYHMPIICALANTKQVGKVLQLANHIQKKNIKNGRKSLQYGFIWDEADQIYPQMRESEKEFDGHPFSIKNILMDNEDILYQNIFVTATEGSLLDDDYPECSNALLEQQELDEEDKPYYRAFHHPESKVKLRVLKSGSNNEQIQQLVREQKQYFLTPYTLKNGEVYYRKIILNANTKKEDMIELAKDLNKLGVHCMTFNQYGVSVYRKDRSPGEKAPNFRIHGERFSNILFFIYKKFALNDAPLAIIGRKKVDRGLGFHYAPRSHRELGSTTVYYKKGTSNEESIQTDGREGLIWTDEFLGSIENKDTAVQKAGRGAGIIAQCPQYPGEITYWTDKETASNIDHHNRVVDTVNRLPGANTLYDAVTQAKAETKRRNIGDYVAADEDPNDPNTVPMVFQVSPDEYASFKRGGGNKWDDTSIFKVLKSKNLEFVRMLEKMYAESIPDKSGKDLVTEPKSDATYKIIEQTVLAHTEKRKYYVQGNIPSEMKHVDKYSMLLDKRNHRVIVTVYFGSRLQNKSSSA